MTEVNYKLQQAATLAGLGKVREHAVRARRQCMVDGDFNPDSRWSVGRDRGEIPLARLPRIDHDTQGRPIDRTEIR